MVQPAIETRSPANRLDQHEEQLLKIQVDMKEIHTIMAREREDEREFRKVLIDWMRQHEPGFSEFYSEWSIQHPTYHIASDDTPGEPQVRKRELADNKSVMSNSSHTSPIEMVSVIDNFDKLSGEVLNPVSSGAEKYSTMGNYDRIVEFNFGVERKEATEPPINPLGRSPAPSSPPLSLPPPPPPPPLPPEIDEKNDVKMTEDKLTVFERLSPLI